MSSRWKHTQPNDSAWRRQRTRVLHRDGGMCQLKLDGCTKVATQVDHLTPWTPGQHVPDSALQAACKNCNLKAGSPEKRNPQVPRPSWLG